METDPRIGTRIASYRIETRLSTDGPSAGYLAHDLRSDQQVVLRLLGRELLCDEPSRERLLRRLELAASLQHPNIVPTLEVGEADGIVFVANPPVEGTSLARLLSAEGRLASGRAIAIVAQLAEALDAARFSRGVLHGGLTPTEVLVTSGGDKPSREGVLLGGFGLRFELSPGATWASAPDHLPPLDYLAPEQIGGGPITSLTDVYALGCILFECLTGAPPFDRTSLHAVRDGRLRELPPQASQFNPDLPPGIDRVVETALARRPEKRYSTCAELASAAQAAFGSSSSDSVAGDEWLAATPRPPGPDGAEEEPLLAPAMDGATHAHVAVAERLRTVARKPIAAIAFASLLAVLLAGTIWLAGRGASEARPSPPPAPNGAAADPAGVEQRPTTAAAAQPDSPSVRPTEPTEPAEPAAPAESGSEGSPGLLVSLGPDSLVRLDATTGATLARIPVASPVSVAADGGSVWVLGGGGPSGALLVRVNAASGAITDIFDADVGSRRQPVSLALTRGSAWLGGFDSGQVYRFAPGSAGAERAPFDANGGFYWPVAAAGSLWGAAYPTGCCVQPPILLQVDPATQRVLAQIEGVGPVAVAGKDFLWTYRREPGSAGPSFALVDPETHSARPINAVGLTSADLTVADGAVWASSAKEGAIVRLDPASGSKTERIRLWRKPGALAAGIGTSVPLAAGSGALWAGNQLAGTVTRYDIATGRVETIDVGGSPNDLVVADGSVWVAVEKLTRKAYIARADSICRAANNRFERSVAGIDVPDTRAQWKLADIAAWNGTAVRLSEMTLAELRTLRAPQGDRPWVSKVLSLIEQQTAVLRRLTAAAASGNSERTAELEQQRVEATQRKDGGVGLGLQSCPLSLPA